MMANWSFEHCLLDSVCKLQRRGSFVPLLMSWYMAETEGDTQMMSLILPEPSKD